MCITRRSKYLDVQRNSKPSKSRKKPLPDYRLPDHFYLPHMEYEGSIGLVSRKFFIADFHVLGLFMAQKHDLTKKNFPSVTRRCTQICVTPTASPSKARKLKFWLSVFF
jgi:hypothetical protein